MVKMTIWTKKMGRSPMVWARNVAEGRYIEKALCLARTARPENAAVVSDSAMSDGTGVSDATRVDVRRGKGERQEQSHSQSRVKKIVPPRKKRPPVVWDVW